ncbi:alpha/beta fold hydrolase [Cellulomonas composti]|uniref:Lysophospholipase n=1 Tax=Cellulomonas composti TaxID=266130 RepID=A0A511J6Z3_9CELL|nr:alpha/beta hydrolase [Cellulomonas composti]GEL93473.1 lysophospholipase [Cellulomonas composti]
MPAPTTDPATDTVTVADAVADAVADVVAGAVELGRPVVFVHGTRTSSQIWREQVEAAEAGGHRSVAIDLPGHGSRSGERFTLEGAIAAIDDAVAGCPTPPLLVGLSLGGYASLAYAGRHQDRLAGVVLAGCSTTTRGKPLRQYGRLSTWLTRALRTGDGTWHVVSDMLHALHGYSPLSDLRRLTVPVWLVNGARDPLRVDERRYVRALPGARLTVVPGAGHDVNSHAPAAFNRILLAALHDAR